MNTKRIINQIDVQSQNCHANRRHYQRPKVTIKNIVTVDSPRFKKSHSRRSSVGIDSPRHRKTQVSRASVDTDYDRVKFLIEERGRYWKNLKILYNDYTLVKVKQKELVESEDTYITQQCIEETSKILVALKDKIQTQCKDIVFITNLFGDAGVNPVVQSLADGEDIDRIIRKQRKVRQASPNKLKKTTCKEDETEEPIETKINVRPKRIPARRKSSLNEPKFFDSELHWCHICNVFPPTIKKYLQHLHDESHKKKSKEMRINVQPWHKCLPEEQAWRTDTTDTVRVKAFNFFVPVNGWFCQLCRSWMGDIHCAATHLRSYVHNMNLKNFQEKFPDWKQGWITERSKALEKTFEDKNNANNKQKERKSGKPGEEESEESSEEETPSQPISKHRNLKTKMWVPNPKAFERVCNEINPVSTSTESPLTKIKPSKKERPAFIGKMPLINSINKNKKIVMKELLTNTSEKIVASCTAYEQSRPNEWIDATERTNDEESELKLKEFMKVAKNVKKASRKKQIKSILPIPADCYNTADYAPIVESSDILDNLIGPVSISQWEADRSYEYHMRMGQMQNYNMPSHMIHMVPPQTFLLDPYHAVALHKQQFYGTQHMISNQYENFEIISRDEEQELVQYLERHSSSPNAQMYLSEGLKSINNVDTNKTERSSQNLDKSSKQLKNNKTTSTVIKKPAVLNSDNNVNDILPTFTETFLSNTDSSGPSTGFISSLLSSCSDVKVVSSNALYKKKMAPSKRRRIKMRKKLNNQNKANETEEEKIPDNSIYKTNIQEETNTNLLSDIKIQISDDIKQKDDHTTSEKTQNTSTPISSPSPKKTTKSVSLKEKINSIRKQIDQNKLLPKLEEDVPLKRIKNENNTNTNDTEKLNKTENLENEEDNRKSSEKINESEKPITGKPEHDNENSDESDDGNDDKLIYYDMTTI